MGQERVVLLLTKSSCGHCAKYTQDIEQLIQQGQLAGFRIGKVHLDKTDSIKFKKANPWIKKVDFIPYTVLFSDGAKVDEFAASRGDYLKLRTGLAWTDVN